MALNPLVAKVETDEPKETFCNWIFASESAAVLSKAKLALVTLPVVDTSAPALSTTLPLTTEAMAAA